MSDQPSDWDPAGLEAGAEAIWLGGQLEGRSPPRSWAEVCADPACDWVVEYCRRQAAGALTAYRATSGDLTEAAKLRALINTPVIDDWFDGVRLEAAHQQERWGSTHDAGKTPLDWFWLIGFLAQKVVGAPTPEKAKHHTISTAAVLFNWYQAITGTDTRMRRGIEPPTDDGPTARLGPDDASAEDVVEDFISDLRTSIRKGARRAGKRFNG